MTVRSSGVHLAIETQSLLARDFNRAAISALRTAAGNDRALVRSVIIRPHHCFASISEAIGADIDGCRGSDDCAGGIAFRTLALETAADQDLAAAS